MQDTVNQSADPDEREGAITLQMRLLEQSLESLGKATETLQTRLAPILRLEQSEESKAVENCKDPHYCDLAGHLMERTAAVHKMENAITTMIQRLEL